MAAIKINKMVDDRFPHTKGKHGKVLLIFSNDDCIIK